MRWLASTTRSHSTPHYVDAHQRRALVLRDLQRHREGEQAARKAIELAPDDPGSWFSLGYALAGLDREGSEQAYRHALGLDPQHVWSLHNLGAQLLIAGEYSEGTRATAASLAIDPLLGSAVVNLDHVLNTALTRLQRVTTIGLWVLGAAVWLSFAPRELSFDSGTVPLAVLTGLHCLGIALVAYLGSAPLRAELPRAGSRHLRTWPRRDPESASQLRVILLIWLMLVVGLVVSLATGSAWGTVVATVLAALLNVGRFVVATYKEQMQSFG